MQVGSITFAAWSGVANVRFSAEGIELLERGEKLGKADLFLLLKGFGVYPAKETLLPCWDEGEMRRRNDLTRLQGVK